MKAVILARVSTDEQKEAGNSLPAQQARMVYYIQQRKELDLQLVKEFIFDESAYKEHRKEFGKVLEFLEALFEKQKKAVALICDKVDRLSRDFLIGLPALEKLRREGKIQLHFPSDNLILHKDSPATDLFHFNIAVSLAQYYSNSISDNIKRAYETKIKNGEWFFRAKVGYLNVGGEDEKKDIIVDPTKSHYIPQIFQLRANGHSVRDIRNTMVEQGLKAKWTDKPISISVIHFILQDPFYYGQMKIKGKLYPHKYEPLISKELFDKCQEVALGWHRKPFKWASKPFTLRGMIKCSDTACGCTVTPETQKGHIYYHCTNYRKLHDKVTFVREEDLLKPIYKVLEGIQLPESKIKSVTESLRKINDGKNNFHKQQLSNLNKEYNLYQNRIDKLFNMRLDDDGSITKEIFNEKLKEFKEKQSEIAGKIQQYTNADEKFYLTANTLLSLAKRAKQIFISSEPTEKRQLLNFLLQNLVLDGKNLKFELKTPFDRVLEANKCSDLCSHQDSNLEPIA